MIGKLKSLDNNYLNESRLKIEALKIYIDCRKTIKGSDMSKYNYVEIINNIEDICVNKDTLLDKADDMFEKAEGLRRKDFEDEDEYAYLMTEHFWNFDSIKEHMVDSFNPYNLCSYFNVVEKSELRNKLFELKNEYGTFYRYLTIRKSTMKYCDEYEISDECIHAQLNDPEIDDYIYTEVRIQSNEMQEYVKKYKLDKSRMMLLRYIIQTAILADDRYTEILVMDIREDDVYVFIKECSGVSSIRIDYRYYSDWIEWVINIEVIQDIIKARLIWEYFLK